MQMDVIEQGQDETKTTDPDEFRAWVRDNKDRSLRDKRLTEQEAVKNYVKNGDYVSYDLSGLIRGPMALIREIIRQKKRDLWVAAKFSLLDTLLLTGGGCASKIDVGFAGVGRQFFSLIEAGKVKTIEWTNGTLALRHLAGAMGVPFLPTRALLGSETFKRSGAKIVKDPFTGMKICLVPAIHPDVGMIHANEADKHGNARVYGPSVAPFETAAASKRVIIQTEKIVPSDKIRREPSKTTIPFYMVDAVVEAEYGAHPGTCPGYYRPDQEHILELLGASSEQLMQQYMDKYVFSTKSHDGYLDKIGRRKLSRLREAETISEGYK